MILNDRIYPHTVTVKVSEWAEEERLEYTISKCS
jgi:hypothetical protein